jgi:hypothetical protein
MRKSMIAILGVALALFLMACPAFAEKWHVPGDFPTIQEAVNGASPGDKILVGAGQWYGAEVNKPVEITGKNGAVINSGPEATGIISGLKLVTGSAGAKISHLQFEQVQVGIAGMAVDDVIVTQCTFIKLGQGLLCFGAHGWKITHNEIRDPQFIYTPNAPNIRGGGGINLIARVDGVVDAETCTGNVIEHNKFLGTVGWNVPSGKGTPTTQVGWGILLMRQVNPGGSTPGEISQNWIIFNDIELVSGEELSIVGSKTRGIAITDNSALTHVPGIHDNTIAFNDFRGCDYSIGTTITLYDVLGENIISRNLGGPGIVAGIVCDIAGIDDNRGHGVIPASKLKP